MHYQVTRLAKEVNRDVKTVVDGPHVTFLLGGTLNECPYIDYVVRGEGEYTFKELIKAIEKRKGLGFSHLDLINF